MKLADDSVGAIMFCLQKAIQLVNAGREDEANVPTMLKNLDFESIGNQLICINPPHIEVGEE